MKNKSILFVIARDFILLNAFIWLVFAVLVGIGVLPFNMGPAALRVVLAVLALIAGATLLVLYYFLGKHNRPAYYLTLIMLIGIIILTFTDEFGLADLIYLVIALVPFVLLLASRRWYFRDSRQKT
ncbi:MAG: hypothetical protein WBV22_08990 [Anaerolineaceae bacterium]